MLKRRLRGHSRVGASLGGVRTDVTAAERLAAAHVYLCTDAREDRGDLEEFLDAALGGGVDIVQLRHKGLEAKQELAYLEIFADAASRHGALVAANDRADIAKVAGTDVLHVGQDDLSVADARSIVGDETLVGRSTHDREQVDVAAADVGVSYFCVGPTWPTPTKPGRPAPGLELLRYAASRNIERPWFAIGGIDLSNLDQVQEAGATRVVVVRAITEADDPGAAAAEFKRRLQSS